MLAPTTTRACRAVHHIAPAALADACVVGVGRLVHVSALGLDQQVTSGFLISKRHGEAAIRAFGHLQLMQHDNVPRVNHLSQLLQIKERMLEK